MRLLEHPERHSGAVIIDPKVGDPQGVMGIELSTVDANGNAIFKAGDVTGAFINLAPVDRSQNC